MIFKPVSALADKTEKSIFLELAGVYIRLVEVFCQKNGLEPVPSEAFLVSCVI